MTIDDAGAFIVANTRLLPVPHAPEIRLHVADEATALWSKTEEELGELGLPPPFWAFAWAGGQALARFILDHPEHVRGRDVLDFACGSGLVAIAAARSGARSVTAIDIDLFAQAATQLNAAANGVAIDAQCGDLVGETGDWQVVLAGDVFYERPLAGRLVDWFSDLAGRGIEVLVGDPGRHYLPARGLQRLAEYRVPVTRMLEDNEIKHSRVWRFHGHGEVG